MTSMRRVRISIALCMGALASTAACNQRDAGTASPPVAPVVAPTPVAVAPEHPDAATPPGAAAAPAPLPPPDAAPTPPVVPDAAPAPKTARTKADREAESVALQREAERYASALFSEDSAGSDLRGSNDHRPGADLNSQLSDVGARGANVRVGGGTRGGNGGPGPGTGRGPTIDPEPMPSRRITIATQRALDTTSLEIGAVVAKIQAAYFAALHRCYKEALKRDPASAGVATFALTVGTSGRVTDATIDGLGAPLTSCLQARVREWRFAPPTTADGAATTARFTLALRFAPT
jgi:hypothetical protein